MILFDLNNQSHSPDLAIEDGSTARPLRGGQRRGCGQDGQRDLRRGGQRQRNLRQGKVRQAGQAGQVGQGKAHQGSKII
jgi:hypothetical protein